MAGPRSLRSVSPIAALGMLTVVVGCGFLSSMVIAQGGNGGGNANPIASLKGVAVPQPADLSRYVSDSVALVVLGKALFWDTQVGSDGRTACATCHFHAGADHRLTNQIAGAQTSTDAVRPNTTLTTADFPFHAFTNPNDNTSAPTRARRDVVGSAGLAKRTFVSASDGTSVELGADGDLGLFSLNGVKARQVTSRNTPSVINAVFYFRNFWDGRASNVFNAVTPFGVSDSRASVLVVTGSSLVEERVRLDQSSLASQAVGPPLNGIEMSFDGRAWADLGRKLLSLPPLARQVVAVDDSCAGGGEGRCRITDLKTALTLLCQIR
jgi:cytochrome c peroxidase